MGQDNLINAYPQKFAEPNETGVGVHLTFGEGEWATFSRFINHASLGGAAFDHGTRVGVPLVGQGGGVYVLDDANSYIQGAVYAAGVAMAGEHEVTTLPAAARIVVQNGAQHLARVDANGRFEVSLDSGATWSTANWNMVGRGPFHWIVTHDGVNQNLYINRRLADSDAVVLGVPAGNSQIGRSGTSRRIRYHATQPAVVPMYLRDFAKQILFHWQPSAVGEGPAGGIPTGAVGEGDWSCALGGANLKFVWVNDLSLPAGGFLALTDDGALSMRRLDFMIPKSPMMGSWLVRYRTRSTAIGGDCPRVGLIRCRGDDMTAAGSQSIWFESLNNGGGWWRTQTYRENAGLIGVDCDILAANVPNGDDCATLLTHHVDGNFRIYEFSRTSRGWAWRAAAVVNDVTWLSYNYFSIAPRGSYIKSMTCFQGEMDPHELGMNVV